ncbi:MAG: HD domain-containing protein [Deltaproteobacteria bacterium]|nr:HD domain-containing protein [Deltaproteobacteria bacterium]
MNAPKPAAQAFKPAEVLTMSLLRLPQLIKIHQHNNKILVENLAAFRQCLQTLWQESEIVVFRAHRGRVFLNNRRLVLSQTVMATAAKLVEFLEARGFFGYSFAKVDNLVNAQIIELFQAVNQCAGQKEPGAWLAAKLASNWATPVIDQDFKIALDLADDGTGQSRPILWDPDVRAMALKDRKSYSRALSEVTNLNGQLDEGGSTKLSKTRRVVQDMVEGLTKNENLLLSLSTIRDYDDYTCTHSVNVAILSMCLGKRLGLGKVQIMTLGLSALFHDLGKVDIPIELIRKTSKFTPEEYEVVKNHSLHSVLRILRLNVDHNLKCKLMVAPMEHHLGVNLGGYPKTQRASPLSLFGRIVAIADHYDALTSSRSYRPVPISPDEALNIMLKLSGTELDTLLLKVFVNMIGIYPVGTLLLLDTQEVAMVSQTPQGATQARPQCLLLAFENEELIRGESIDLTEKGADGRFLRNVARCFHPSEFGLNPAELLT